MSNIKVYSFKMLSQLISMKGEKNLYKRNKSRALMH